MGRNRGLYLGKKYKYTYSATERRGVKVNLMDVMLMKKIEFKMTELNRPIHFFWSLLACGLDRGEATPRRAGHRKQGLHTEYTKSIWQKQGKELIQKG